MEASPAPVIDTSLAAGDLALSVDTFALGWQAALTRPPKFETTSLDFSSSSPKAIALKVPRVLPRVYSFTFPECPSYFQPPPPKEPAPPKVAAETVDEADANADSDQPAKKLTRIKPPGDIIKLEDRLYYVLQPPLETLLSPTRCTFPFEPFPYQFEGVAFLYPRYAAVLADEMGLGKTMQAITAIRLLLRAGEVRSVLLDLPQAAGDQLAAGVRHRGRRRFR